MEDFINKLNFNVSSVQYKAVSKLLENVISKKPPHQVISSNSIQIPDLKLLWEKSGDSCPIVSNLCCQALVSLAKDGHAELDYIINGFLSIVPSMKNINDPVSAIIDLLVFQMNQLDGKVNSKSPYSVRNHPLISVLRERSDSGAVITACIENLLWDESMRTYYLKQLSPVIFHILISPNQSTELSLLKNLIFDQLVQFNDHEAFSDFVSFCLPWLQMRSTLEISEVTVIIKKISKSLSFKLSKMGNKDDCIISADFLAFILLSLCHLNLVNGLDTIGILHTLESLVLTVAEENCTLISESCICLISTLVKECAGETLNKLLRIGQIFLQRKETSSLIAAMMCIPLLQIIAESPDIDKKKKQKNLNTALQLMKNLERISQNVNYTDKYSRFEENFRNFSLLCFNESISEAFLCARFSYNLMNLMKCSSKSSWLSNVKLLVQKSSLSQPLFHLLAAVLFTGIYENDQIHELFEILKSAIKNMPEQAYQLFLLLLYKVRTETNPEVQFSFLKMLPAIACHKLCVPPVLGIIKLLAQNEELTAQSVYLMVELWKQQDRCFPFLQNMLCESSAKRISLDLKVNDIRIAQAAAIKEICQMRPHQHGPGLLGILSRILSEASNEASIPIAALSLDGIYALCKNEVIDVRSTWRALAPKLARDKRPFVITRLFRLLALSSQLRQVSFEYDKFLGNTVEFLWKYVSKEKNPVILGEAYKTLAAFPSSFHELKLLPSAAKQNLKLPPSMCSTPFEIGKLPEDVLTYIPGYCFIDILKSFDDEITLKGYSEFLGSLFLQEVKELPRSIHRIAMQATRPTNQSKIISSIPGFLCSKFDSNRQPGIRGSLAVGVLLSYEPPPELGKDGQPTTNSLFSQAKYYEQVFEALLQDVSLDYNEWRQCTLISSSWSTFMDRAFSACEEARKATIEMDRSHGRLEGNAEKIKAIMGTAWLWVRDRFQEIIRLSIKGKSSSHANAILSISGLSATLCKLYNNLDDSAKLWAQETEHLNHHTYISNVTETLLCVLNPQRQPTGNVMGWLTCHSSKISSTGGSLVRGCVAFGICHLVPNLLSSDGYSIQDLCELLVEQLEDSSSVMQCFFGIALGLLVQTLCHEGFLESGQSQSLYILKISEKLRNACFTKDSDIRTGSLIGLTLVVASFCSCNHEKFQSFVKCVVDQFHERLLEADCSSVTYEVLCLCVAKMMISAASASLINIEIAGDLMSWFDDRRQEQPNCGGTAMALGTLAAALQRLGYSKITKIKEGLFQTWKQILSFDGNPTLGRLAALKGLSFLYSCGGGLSYQKNSDIATSYSTEGLNDVIQLMMSLMNNSRDVALQNNCSWLLGELCSIHTGLQTSTPVPFTYFYLKETSILKPTIDFIHKNGNSVEPKFKLHVKSCLNSLCQNFPRALPPLNWVTLLSPSMHSKDPELMKICLKIALYQSSSSSTAAAFLSSYLSPPLISTLSVECNHLLISSLPVIVKSISSLKLQLFLKRIFSVTLSFPAIMSDEGNLSLRAILDSLQILNRTQDAAKILCQTIESAAMALLPHMEDFEKEGCMTLFCECLSALTEEKLDKVTSVHYSLDTVVSATILRCYLVEYGYKSLFWLTPCIDASENFSQSDKQNIISHILKCVTHGLNNPKSEISKPSNCISWLSELMGKINGLLGNKSDLRLSSSSEVFVYIFGIWSAVILGCAGLEAVYTLWPLEDVSEKILLQTTSYFLPKLFNQKEWKEMTSTILNWLTNLVQSSQISDNIKLHLILFFIPLRGCNEFSKSSVWANVLETCI